jgi:hypothetical protein
MSKNPRMGLCIAKNKILHMKFRNSCPINNQRGIKRTLMGLCQMRPIEIPMQR